MKKLIRRIDPITLRAGRKTVLPLIAILIFSGLPFVSGAQEKEPVISLLTAKKVTADAKGKEKLESADTAKPGEVIQYEATYRNQSDKDVSNLKATVPIPVGMELLADSAKPSPAEASLDGKTYEAFPLKRTVTLPDGTTAEEAVPLSQYRSLRWNVGDLKAGKSASVTARAKLINTSEVEKQ
jgi:uncharacterized repeat protein (TIGR01451 family)